MSKFVMDFEEWFYEHSLPCKGDWFKRGSCGDYDSPSTYYAWMGWQASRAALVVELPAQWSNQCYDDEIMFSGQVIDAIESAGISYK